MPGIIVYVKISMTGDEPSDVQKYAKKDPRFPHQPTDLRQSFDEEQFESYRALGDHIARRVFGDAVADLRDDPDWSNPHTRDEYIRGNQRLLSNLRGRWAVPATGHDESYIQSAKDWTRLMRDISKEPDLAELSRDLYPELDDATSSPMPPAPTPGRLKAELHAVGQMLQIMEDAWLNLGLKGHYDLPMERGWMNVFRRWTSTRAFHRLWPTLYSEFSPDFVKFCNSQLHLEAARPPFYLAVPANYEDGQHGDPFARGSIERLAEEFKREWPGEAWPVEKANGVPGPSRDLGTLVARAGVLHNRIVARAGVLHNRTSQNPLAGNNLPAWLIVQAPSGEQPAAGSDGKFACGIFLVCEYLDYLDPQRDAAGNVSYPPVPPHVRTLLLGPPPPPHDRPSPSLPSFFQNHFLCNNLDAVFV